jgi:dihydrofolate synthase/folylpolyglutamate synthase
VAAIVSVGFDHERQLGTTIAEIAREKAGIVKPGAELVLGRLPREAEDVVEAAAAAAGVAPRRVRDVAVDARRAGDRFEISARTAAAAYGPVRLALAGRHQVDNAVVAILLLEALAARGHAVRAADIETGLADARWPARLDWIEDAGGRMLVDGAHNPAGAQALASYLIESGHGPLPIVFGVMQDKAIGAMVAALAPVARPLIATRAPGGRAAEPADIAAHAAALGLEVLVEPEIGAALARARAAGDPICVAGSLYMAGEVLARLGRAPE